MKTLFTTLPIFARVRHWLSVSKDTCTRYYSNYQSRRYLEGMPPGMLKDLGIDQNQQWDETHKRFWID